MDSDTNTWDKKFEIERERLHQVDREVADGTMELLDHEMIMAEKKRRLKEACNHSSQHIEILAKRSKP